jgi:hypothetical protein
MRLTVQQLLAGAHTAHRGPQATESVAEELPLGTGKRWGSLSVANLPLRTGDSIGEVPCPQIDLAQAGVKADECVRIFGRRDVSGSHGLVVGPHRDSEGITQIDTGLNARLKVGHRAIRFSEAESNLDFELGFGLMRSRRDPRENIARDQAHGDAVRVVNDDRIVDSKAQRRSSRPPSLNCAPEFWWFHGCPRSLMRIDLGHRARSPRHSYQEEFEIAAAVAEDHRTEALLHARARPTHGSGLETFASLAGIDALGGLGEPSSRSSWADCPPSDRREAPEWMCQKWLQQAKQWT